MRPIITFVLLLAACAKEAPPPPPTAPIAAGRFAAGARDGLCIAGTGAAQRAGFIAFGDGNRNCAATGTIVGGEGEWALRPTGDDECRIPLRLAEDGIALGAMTPACSYYCAPGLSFAGKSFARADPVAPAPKDLGGDPLC